MIEDDELDRLILAVDKEWSVPAWGKFLVRAYQRDPTISLVRIERRLRAVDRKVTYFVARSLRVMPRGLKAVMLDQTTADYWLWICLQGYQEAALARAPASVEENLKRLERTGMLVADSIKFD